MTHPLGNPVFGNPNLGHTVTHLWLLRRMARAQAVDLAAAQAEGRLTQSDWAGMVMACRACAAASDCSRIMDRDARMVSPVWCANAAALHRIAATEDR